MVLEDVVYRAFWPPPTHDPEINAAPFALRDVASDGLVISTTVNAQFGQLLRHQTAAKRFAHPADAQVATFGGVLRRFVPRVVVDADERLLLPGIVASP